MAQMAFLSASRGRLGKTGVMAAELARMGCRFWLTLVGVLALAGPAWAQSASKADPVGAVQQARSLAASGDHAGAARMLEGWLVRSIDLVGPADIAVLQLEVARHAANAGDLVLARRLLATADRADSTVAANMPAPSQARFRRQRARLHEQLGNYAVAERLLVGAVDNLAVSDPAAASEAANALGMVRLELARFIEAGNAFSRSLALLECGTTTASSVNCTAIYANLANAAASANDLPAARKAASSAFTAAGVDGRSLRVAALARAQVLLRDVDAAAAERALADVASLASGQDKVLHGFALYLTAASRFERGLFPEAEQAALAADVVYRSVLGETHPARARVLHLLAVLDTELGDHESASRRYDRVEQITGKLFGAQSIQTTALSLERVRLDIGRHEYPRARARAVAAQRALANSVEPNAYVSARIRIALGLVAAATGQEANAVLEFSAARSFLDGVAHRQISPEMGFTLLNLGRAQTKLGSSAAAMATLDRAIQTYDRLGASAATWRAEALAARAELKHRQGDRAGALDDGRRSVSILREQILAAGTGASQVREGAREVLAAQARLVLEAQGPEAGFDEAFAAAQLAFASRAGDAVRLAAGRLAARNDGLAALLREQDAAAGGLRQAETLLRASLLQSGPASAAAESKLQEIRRALGEKLGSLQDQIRTEYPAFARYAEAPPVAAADLRAALAPDEAVLMPFASRDGALLFAFTREAAQVFKVDLTRAKAGKLVARLRAGLDLGRMQAAGRVLSFDVEASHELYRALIEPASPLLRGKQRLTVIADGALQTFPPAVLLDPNGGWLVRRFVLAATPSPGALIAARDAAKLRTNTPDEQNGAFLGVGDPRPVGTHSSDGSLRGISPELREAIIQLPQLPETRDELQRMVSLYTSDRSRLLLGLDATRAALSSADLAGFQVIAFATHAAMAGELPGLLEPVIFLTPAPDDAADTGLLPASEITAMQLDADLVLLSACNTAAPDGGPMGEGYSGLARAFLYAGARSLLVSHWAVNSATTAKLTSDFLSRFRSAPSAGKASALQGAMLALLDGPDPEMRHPAFWAPFVLVGD